MDIAIRRSEQSKPRPSVSEMGWGKYFTDHMFLMDFDADRGWHDARITPYEPFALDPAASVLHYAQGLFEGLKAIRQQDGKICLFRPDRHCQRMTHSANRMCMPVVPPEAMIEGIRELVKIDQDWVPSAPNTALYIRPTLIGTEPFLGVRPSRSYTFFIIASPVGAYYAEGFEPVSIWIESECVRAARGGLGSVKAGANYAASIFAAERAKKNGYSQVLWLDAAEHKYLEEVGTMNLFVMIDNVLITPALEGSILDGVTRSSVMTLLRSWNCEVIERPVSVDEIVSAHASGRLKEVFGCGTGAVISPVGVLGHKDKRLVLNGGKAGPMARRIFDELTGIQHGRIPDKHGWLLPLT